MFIQTEETPNPATLKFLPGKPVLDGGTVQFIDAAEAAARSPLAERLFRIDGVRGVFLAAEFITVTKADTLEWYLLKPAVLGAIMEHYTAGEPVLREGVRVLSDTADDDDDEDEVVATIRELIETRVRPAVAQDGGDIRFDRFENGIVYLQMQGSCSGCPSSTATLKMGIENMLRHYVPEVQAVRAVN